MCVHFFGSIIESIGHLSFCKKRDFYVGDSGEKMGHAWFLLFFGWGYKKKIYIYFTKIIIIIKVVFGI